MCASSLCVWDIQAQMYKPGEALWGFTPALLWPHCCQYLKGGKGRYAEPCPGPKGLSFCDTGRELSKPTRVSGEQCQGQEEDTSPVQMSPRCRWTNLASEVTEAMGKWPSCCRLLLWVPGGFSAKGLAPPGQQNPYCVGFCRVRGSPGSVPVQGSRDLLWS